METKRYIYRCRRCRRHFAKDHEVRLIPEGRRTITWFVEEPKGFPPQVLCPLCGREVQPHYGPVAGRAVEGTYTPGVPCNAKCVNATGPACSCSCGGANHAGGHLH